MHTASLRMLGICDNATSQQSVSFVLPKLKFDICSGKSFDCQPERLYEITFTLSLPS
jgi:hypothetical protein